MVETSQHTKGIRNVNYTPNGRAADASTPRVCILASHPDIADAYGVIQPQEILTLASAFGVVKQAGLWVDRFRLTDMTFVGKWTRLEYTVHPMKPVRHKVYAPFTEMRFQAKRFADAYEAYHRTVILVVNQLQSRELTQLIRDMQGIGVRVILFALVARSSPVSETVDLVVPFRSAMKGGFDLLQDHCPGMVDELQREDPKGYELFERLLSIDSTERQDEEVQQLRQRIIHVTEPLPPIILAALAILQAQQHSESESTFVPLNTVSMLLQQYEIARSHMLRALQFMLEEGTLLSENGVLGNAQYNRPADDPVFGLGATLWNDFQTRRPQVLTDRLLTAIEIAVTDSSLIDKAVEEDLHAFITLQEKGGEAERKTLYHSWGLKESGIAEFERRAASLLQEAPDPGPANESSGDAHPKLAACLLTGHANDQGLDPDPAGLRQAS